MAIGVGLQGWSFPSIIGALTANAALAKGLVFAQANNVLKLAVRDYLDWVFKWLFFGTQGYYNWVFPSFIPGSEFALSVGGQFNPVQGFTNANRRYGGVIRIFGSGGLYLLGTVLPGWAPPLKNFLRPLNLKKLARKLFAPPGNKLRIPISHGFQHTELGDYITGDLAVVFSAGITTITTGLRLAWSFTDGTTRWEVGSDVGHGTGVAIELGVTVKVPYG